MSAGLAHEIRNPLGVIKGSAEMLVQKLKDSEPLSSELAGYIFTEVNRLNALVARFLDFARPSHLELHPVQITSILDRALDSVKSQIPDANVTVERQYDPAPNIQVDEQLCERVFVNLIQNAFQAMQSDSGASARILRLRVTPALAGVDVIVEDTGPGVPPELREQVFNPFYTSKKDGVGLGLAIVAKFVDAHRGRITLEANSPHGARFRIFLPNSPQ
jgi:two-component system, NtrC family, sensor histidine kinase HydH